MTELLIQDLPRNGELDGQQFREERFSIRRPNNGYLAKASGTRRFSERASIILIGIQGAGKRSLGFIAAAHLGRRLITEGHYFQEIAGRSKADYLSEYGKAEYYRCCRDVFHRMLSQNEWNCVIECGMASLNKEAQQLLRRFSTSHPVIYVNRDFDQISRSLHVSEVDRQRLRQWDLTHRQFSCLEFHNLFDSTSLGEIEIRLQNFQAESSFILRDIKLEFSRFVDFVLGRTPTGPSSRSPFALNTVPLEQRVHTFAAVVGLSQILSGDVDLEDIEGGEDAVRLMIDCRSHDLLDQICKSVALIRRKVGIPIIYDASVAAITQKDFDSKLYLELLEHGLRLGIDFLVVDLRCGTDIVSRISSRKGYTKLIGKWSDQASNQASQWLSEERLMEFGSAISSDIEAIEMSQKAYSRQDNLDILLFQNRAQASAERRVPLICYNTGLHGKSSLVFNSVLTPVKVKYAGAGKEDTEEPLATAAELTAALFGSFALDGLHFFVIGNLGAHSLSPPMHNAAYEQLGMKHDYTSHEASRFEQLRVFLEDPYFGGCSVNTPYKVTVYEQLMHKSPHAEAIGAVNTLLPLRKLEDGTVPHLIDQASQRNRAGPVVGFYGDNTDWIGFVQSLQRRLSPRNAISAHTTGLILGAGGAARAGVYAMIHLGCHNIFVCDRTMEAAVIVANHFNVWMRANTAATKDYVHVIPNIDTRWPVGCQPPIMILSCIPGMVAGSENPTGFTIREDWLASPSGGVVADVSLQACLI